MDRVILDRNWQMKIEGENVYGIFQEWIDAQIPGSVYGTLLAHNLMPDPYDRMNELDALRLMENSFCFQTVFELCEEQLRGDFLLLRFEGIDTLAEVYLNGRLLGHTDNMHRIWEFDIVETAQTGENVLRVELASPTGYIAEEN